MCKKRLKIPDRPDKYVDHTKMSNDEGLRHDNSVIESNNEGGESSIYLHILHEQAPKTEVILEAIACSSEWSRYSSLQDYLIFKDIAM